MVSCVYPLSFPKETEWNLIMVSCCNPCINHSYVHSVIRNLVYIRNVKYGDARTLLKV